MNNELILGENNNKNILIGKRIEETRKEKKMSLEDVAKMVGVAKTTIMRYEAGSIKNLKLPVLEAIAKALEVNSSWLIFKSEIKDEEVSRDYMNKYLQKLEERPELLSLLCRADKLTTEQIEKAIKVFDIFIDK